jgi:hypothetical protein
MSVVDPGVATARMLPLRFGLDPAFRPRPELARGGHVLYVGRLSREKGVSELLHAAAASREPWRLVLLAPDRRQTRCESAPVSLACRRGFAARPTCRTASAWPASMRAPAG